MTTPTDWNDISAPHFASTGRRILLGNATTGRFTFVYVPSEQAVQWDMPGETATHSLGSRYGFYTYCRIKVTGREDRYPKHLDGPARKIRVTIDIGTEDEETVSGWLIGGGDSL